MKHLTTVILLATSTKLLKVHIHLTMVGKLRIDSVEIVSPEGVYLGQLEFYQLTLEQVRWLEYFIKVGICTQWVIEADPDYVPGGSEFPS